MQQPEPSPSSPTGRPARAARRIAAAIAVVVATLLLFLAGWTTLVATSPAWAGRHLSARLHRPVQVGSVRVRLVRDGVEVRAGDVRLAQARWAGPGDLARIGEVRAVFPLSSLLRRRPTASALALRGLRLRLLRDERGRVNWAGDASAGGAGPPLEIGRLTIEDGRLDWRDRAHDTSLNAAVTADGGSAGLRIVGRGLSERRSWRIAVVSSARDWGAEGRPYPFGLVLVQGASRLKLQGVAPGLHLSRIDGRIWSAGPDMHDLARVTGVPYPHTPPYALQARVRGEGERIRIDGLSGRVGETAVGGEVLVALTPEGRRVDATLATPVLRIQDLIAVVSGGQVGGRGPKTPGALAPAVRIDAPPLRPLSGEVRFEAAQVRPTALPIRSLKLRARFDRGLVRADPLDLRLAQGDLRLDLALDVRRSTPAVGMEARLTDASVSAFLHDPHGGAPPLQTALYGRVALRGAGPTLADALSHSAGRVELTGRGGEVRRSRVEFLTGDIGGALLHLGGGRENQAPLLCSTARLSVRGGVARVERLAFATPQGLVHGEGAVDLGGSTLDLRLSGRPARRGLVTATPSVRIHGPLGRPQVAIDLGGPAGALKAAVSILTIPLSRGAQPAVGGCS